VSRQSAYHGATLGALALNGIPELREPFLLMMKDAILTSNTRRIVLATNAAEVDAAVDGLLAELERQILDADPSTVAMMIIEPVQNHGGMLTAPIRYGEVQGYLRSAWHSPCGR
jgi:adenosylmethionine-8-amino-7-oxononanoate aminotransferase